MDDWNPLLDDYENESFNCYRKGPGKHLSPIGSKENNFRYIDVLGLFVTNIPSSLTEEGFKNLFSKYGTLKNIRLIPANANPYTFGFVDYYSNEDAEEARQALNGYKINENFAIKVAYKKIKDKNVEPHSQTPNPIRKQPCSPSSSSIGRGELLYGKIISEQVTVSHGRISQSSAGYKKLLDDNIKHCDYCNSLKSLKICSGCRKVMYCSNVCQMNDWSNHKLECKISCQSRNSPRSTNNQKIENVLPQFEDAKSTHSSNEGNRPMGKRGSAPVKHMQFQEASKPSKHDEHKGHQSCAASKQNYGTECYQNSKGSTLGSPMPIQRGSAPVNRMQFQEVSKPSKHDKHKGHQSRAPSKQNYGNECYQNSNGSTLGSPMPIQRGSAPVNHMQFQEASKHDTHKGHQSLALSKQNYGNECYQNSNGSTLGSPMPIQRGSAPVNHMQFQEASKHDKHKGHQSRAPSKQNYGNECYQNSNGSTLRVPLLCTPVPIQGKSKVMNNKRYQDELVMPSTGQMNEPNETTKGMESNSYSTKCYQSDVRPHYSHENQLVKSPECSDYRAQNNKNFNQNSCENQTLIPKYAESLNHKRHKNQQVKSLENNDYRAHSKSYNHDKTFDQSDFRQNISHSNQMQLKKDFKQNFRSQNVESKPSVFVENNESKSRNIQSRGIAEEWKNKSINNSNSDNINVTLFKDLSELVLPQKLVQVIYQDGDSWDEFHVQLCENSNKISSLSADINKYCKKSQTEVHIKPTIGQLWCAHWNNEWYRSVICKIQNQVTVKVKFIDYGNEDLIKINELRPLSKDLIKLPAQAIKCKINSVRPLGRIWCDQSIDVFKSVVVSRPFYVNFISVENGVHSVDIFSDVNGEQNVAKTLLNDSLAMNKFEDPKNDAERNDDISSDLSILIKKLVTFDQDIPNVLSTLHVEDLVTLFITVDNQSETWAILSPGNKIIELQQKLCHGYSSLDTSNYRPSIGDIVAAKSTQDNEWYRGRVVRFEKSNFVVFYLDFGNFEEIKVVAKLQPEFFKYPAYAVCCSLIKPNSIGNQFKLNTNYICTVKSVKDCFTLGCNISEKSCEITCRPEIIVSSDIRDATIEVGEELVGIISDFYDWTNFCFLTDDNIKNLMDATEVFDDYCTQSSATSYKPITEELVFGRFDDAWYRAMVLSQNDDSVYKVLYYDYGNVGKLCKEDIRQMPRRFNKLPKLSHKGILQSFKNIPINSEISNFMLEGKKHIHILGKVDDMFSVKITTEDGKDIADVIKEMSIASVQNESASTPLPRLESPCLQNESCEESNHGLSYETLEVTDDDLPPELDSSSDLSVSRCSQSSLNSSIGKKESNSVHVEALGPLSRYRLEDCVSMKLDIDSELDLTILSFYSPDNVSCAILTEESIHKLEDLTISITEYCNGIPNSRYEPIIEEVCFAKYHEDERWYRAMVLESADVCAVYFLDYGNMEMISVLDIRKIMDPTFLQLPFQAISCRIHGVKPLEDDWPEDIKERMSEIIETPSLNRAKVISLSSDFYDIQFSSIKDALIQAKLANTISP